jgi:CheY-like chemotaxis protein
MATILVVDDSPVDRHLAGKLLEKAAGLTVVYAADGRSALDLMRDNTPDLVLTDMQMPGLDGLQLTGEIRTRFPSVPVILMTAHGSEELAVQALQQGASSYVPKRNLGQDLAETVENVLGVAKAAQTQERLLESLTQTDSHYMLRNDITLIPPLIGHLQENLARMKLCDEVGRLRVTVALQEALVNAIYHGNLEVSSELREQDDKAYQALLKERQTTKPYRDRRVYVTARETPAEAVYVIRDEGPGFDPSSLPDPTDPANVEKVSGRGLFLIRTFMDRVEHNEAGNQITMLKRCDR